MEFINCGEDAVNIQEELELSQTSREKQKKHVKWLEEKFQREQKQTLWAAQPAVAKPRKFLNRAMVH